MEALKELTMIVTRNKIKKIDIIGEQDETQTRIHELYELVKGGQVESDEDAASMLFPEDCNGISYRKLKSDLLRRLTNTLFFIDVKKASYSDRQSAYYTCYRDYAAAYILQGKNARVACMNMCHKILRHSEKYEFNDLNRDVSKMLCLFYGSLMGDVPQYEKYKEKFQYYDQVVAMENEAEFLYNDLIVQYVNNSSSKTELREVALRFYQRLEPWLASCDAYRLHLYASLIHLMVYTTVNDYAGALTVCDQMIRFFEAKPYDSFTPLKIAYYQKMACYTQLRQYDEGKSTAEKCLTMLDEGSYNWFKYYELYFMLAMHSGKYREAFEIFVLVTEHSRFRFLPENVIETWKIYKAYLHFLINSGHIAIDGEDGQFSKFRPGRFLNNIPIYSKDKRGMNIAILSIQIIFLIFQKKYSAAIDRMEAIEKYCSRYLQTPETIRSYYFIKMLLTIPAASFHLAGVSRLSQKYLDQLKASPLEEANQAYKIEIIPYEELWDLVLETLDNSFHQAKKNQSGLSDKNQALRG